MKAKEKLALLLLGIGVYLTGCILFFYDLVGETVSGALTADIMVVITAIFMAKLIDNIEPWY